MKLTSAIPSTTGKPIFPLRTSGRYASPVKDYPYNAEVELINPVADTVANANYREADVEWCIKADDILLKNKGGQSTGNPQNYDPQGQRKK